MASLIFRKGLDAGAAVATVLSDSYQSPLVQQVRADDHTYRAGRLTVHLAKEFGFCYGVDRAVDYAYQASHRFPDRRVFLTGEIIHNPHVNAELRRIGIHFLSDPGRGLQELQPEDVVILPAFGVTVTLLKDLDAIGCTLVDTTCGSVLNVWKNVRRYATTGYTSVIHGKSWHEETRATASQAAALTGAYLIVFDDAEAAVVCDYIRHGGDRAAFLTQFASAVSPGFDPDQHLQRIGLANQTTMLMSESLAIGDQFRAAIRDRWGDATLAEHFQAFDTICSATQDRQDALSQLLDTYPLDLMVVIGGYNSSNTTHLARMCDGRVPTFHIDSHEALLAPDRIRHRPVGSTTETESRDWLPRTGPLRIGLTSGASTPDNVLGTVIATLDRFCNSPA